VKSLAHPEWPYSGTPWEWRGFARKLTEQEENLIWSSLMVSGQVMTNLHMEGDEIVTTVYQKQNFGPELK
jgi:hypothetical protein